ncbi:MAG: hypothetical protein ACM31C_17790 [Acidobacteriota bacterium]
MRGWLALVAVLGAGALASADPGAGVEPDRWSPALYVEPSLSITSGTLSSVPAPVGPYLPHNGGSIVTQIGAGLLLRDHVAGDTWWRLHGGLVASFTGLRPPGVSPTGVTAVGVEAEADLPVARRLRVGLHASAGRGDHGVDLLTLGARVHLREIAWAGVDVFHLTRANNGPSCSDEIVPDCTAAATGVMAGVGFEGKVGAIVGIGGVTLSIIIVAIAVASFHIPS